MKGRTCRHDSTYTKRNSKTGRCYAVQVCNPSDAEATEAQTEHRSAFGKISKALTIWISNNHENSTDAYAWVMKQFKAQSKCATLRGYMMSKNMAVVSSTDATKVIVTVNGTASTVDVSKGTISDGGNV